MRRLVQLSRVLATLLISLGLAAPGLDACLCDLFTAEVEDCCADFYEDEAPTPGAELDGGPCCCCSLDPVTARPAPVNFASLESSAELHVGPENPPLWRTAEPASTSLNAKKRAPSGPDPAISAALLVHRTTVFLI